MEPSNHRQMKLAVGEREKNRSKSARINSGRSYFHSAISATVNRKADRAYCHPAFLLTKSFTCPAIVKPSLPMVSLSGTLTVRAGPPSSYSDSYSEDTIDVPTVRTQVRPDPVLLDTRCSYSYVERVQSHNKQRR